MRNKIYPHSQESMSVTSKTAVITIHIAATHYWSCLSSQPKYNRSSSGLGTPPLRITHFIVKVGKADTVRLQTISQFYFSFYRTLKPSHVTMQHQSPSNSRDVGGTWLIYRSQGSVATCQIEKYVGVLKTATREFLGEASRGCYTMSLENI